jgi:hypothetical protein
LVVLLVASQLLVAVLRNGVCTNFFDVSNEFTALFVCDPDGKFLRSNWTMGLTCAALTKCLTETAESGFF